MECIIKIVGRSDLGLAPTTNGKYRPQFSQSLPVSKMGKARGVFGVAAGSHLAACEKCDAEATVQGWIANPPPIGFRLDRVASKLMKAGRISRVTAFKAMWVQNPAWTLNKGFSLEEILEGLRSAPTSRNETYLVVDGHSVDLWRALLLQKGQIFDGPRLENCMPETLDLVSMLVQFREKNWELPDSVEEVHDSYTSAFCW